MEQKLFFIKSSHNVYIDSYKEGEMDFVNCYDVDSKIWALDYKEALKKYCETVLCYPLENPGNLEFVEDSESFEYNWLVDEDNSYRSERELKAWENGELTLYCNNVSFYVYEMVSVIENK